MKYLAALLWMISHFGLIRTMRYERERRRRERYFGRAFDPVVDGPELESILHPKESQT